MKKAAVLMFIALSSVSAFAQSTLLPQLQPTLPANVLAEVVTSGGFMPPGVVNRTVVTFKTDGTIERRHFHRGDFVPSPDTGAIEYVGKLPANEQATLERAIASVRPGKLVDLDPSSPTGADAPSTSYNVNKHGTALTVAERGGNFHVYALRQKAALAIKAVLDRALSPSRSHSSDRE